MFLMISLKSTLFNLGIGGTGTKIRKRKNHSLKVSLPSLHRLGALIRKNYLMTFRNIGLGFYRFLSLGFFNPIMTSI